MCENCSRVDSLLYAPSTRLAKELPDLRKHERMIWLALSPITVAAMLYSILRAGVRFFGYALPGACTNAWLNLSFSSGVCLPAGSWLTTRMSWATSAHAWSWVMYGGFGLLIAFWPRARGYPFDGFRGFMVTGFAIAIHEIAWFGTYFVVHPYLPDVLFNLQIYGGFIAMCIVGCALFYAFGYHKELNVKVLVAGLGVFALFYSGWAAIGYPLTLDLKVGITPLFALPWVSFIEYVSWLLIFCIVGMAYYAKQIVPH